MKIIEIGTGYTSIPAHMGAATEIVVEGLTKAFMKEKIDVEIFDIKDENRIKTNMKIKEVWIPKILRREDVSLGVIHKIKRVVYSINLALKLKKEVKRNKEKKKKIVLHFHNQYNMFFFCKLTPKKIRENAIIFYTVHSYIWNGKWNDIKDIIKKRYFQEVYSIKNADKVFVLNNITEEHLKEHLDIDNKKIRIIANGVDTDVYKPLERDANDEITIFQVGSVCERKNQLESIKRLTKYIKNDNVKFMYAGRIIEQDYKEKIDQYIEKNKIKDNVKYLGELKPGEELNKYYNQSKALIFPSKTESFGLVVLEAMASELPVITNNESLKNILKDIEVLEYKDEKDFDKIMKDKIFNEQERKRIGKLVKKIVFEQYSWDAVAKKYLNEIY